MTKMNRRDYLIGIGATAGVLAAGKLDLLARDGFEESSPINSMQTNGVYVPSGPNAYDLLPTQAVKLVFHGLMGIASVPGGCKVGFHSKPSRKHKHHLKIMAFRNCVPEWPAEKEVPIHANPVLAVHEPDLISGVKFYQPPLAPKHKNDFRHVIDLDQWYNKHLTWKDDGYKPVMLIENGLFYTLLKTASTFKKQNQGASPTSPGDFVGSVASYVGVNIYLKPRGYVTLKIPEAGIDLRLEPGTKNEVHFNNDCSKVGASEKCKFRHGHPSDETERSDFYMHADAAMLPAGVRYQLVRENRLTSPPRPDICQLPHHSPKSIEEAEMTDEAPCSSLGYGGGQGWPPYPGT